MKTVMEHLGGKFIKKSFFFKFVGKVCICIYNIYMASLLVQTVKNLSAMQETRV